MFGALAELVDNARDAAATKFHVFSTSNKSMRGDFYLNFLDDGEGRFDVFAVSLRPVNYYKACHFNIRGLFYFIFCCKHLLVVCG